MNEEEVQRKRRQNEEDATARRSRILGLAYLDTRDFENELPLVRDVLEKELDDRGAVIVAVGIHGRPIHLERHDVVVAPCLLVDEALNRVEFNPVVAVDK